MKNTSVRNRQHVFEIMRPVDPDDEHIGAPGEVQIVGTFNDKKGTFAVSIKFTTKSVSVVAEKNEGLLNGIKADALKMIDKMNALKAEWNDAHPNGDPDQAELFEEAPKRPVGRPKKTTLDMKAVNGDGTAENPFELGELDPEGVEAQKAALDAFG
jgi:hypothetical protein